MKIEKITPVFDASEYALIYGWSTSSYLQEDVFIIDEFIFKVVCLHRYDRKDLKDSNCSAFVALCKAVFNNTSLRSSSVQVRYSKHETVFTVPVSVAALNKNELMLFEDGASSLIANKGESFPKLAGENFQDLKLTKSKSYNIESVHLDQAGGWIAVSGWMIHESGQPFLRERETGLLIQGTLERFKRLDVNKHLKSAEFQESISENPGFLVVFNLSSFGQVDLKKVDFLLLSNDIILIPGEKLNSRIRDAHNAISNKLFKFSAKNETVKLILEHKEFGDTFLSEIISEILEKNYSFKFSEANRKLSHLRLSQNNSLSRLASIIWTNSKNYEYEALLNEGYIVGSSKGNDFRVKLSIDDGLIAISSSVNVSASFFIVWNGPLLVKVVRPDVVGTDSSSFKFKFNSSAKYLDPDLGFHVSCICNDTIIHSFNDREMAISRIPKLAFEYLRGVTIESHGYLVSDMSQNEAWKKKLVKWYEVTNPVFESSGLRLSLIYGTLLGCIRDGDIISHDGDADFMYLSESTEVEGVKSELLSIVESLVLGGIDVQIVLKGGFFRPVVNGMAIDVFPGWLNSDRLWMHNTTSIEMSESELKPFRTVDFIGHKFFMPNEPKKFIERKYGKGWISPDPSYVPAQPTKEAKKYLHQLKTDDAEIELINKLAEQKGVESRVYRVRG
ncbi:hypothetical protein ACJJI3_12330 [Microbulbifer sp. ZKSA004]|uniref:hypothetical protein n=1 Tax=Microbulbifer sp. ZKSA004 TaxID=3243389 RepID=UPI00403A62B5